jgi:rubrerythrin
MGAIADTLQILERVLEYKKAARDVCLAAARQAGGDTAETLTCIAKVHAEHIQLVPRIFKDLKFAKSSSENDALTEVDVGLFRMVGKGSTLDLLGAAVKVEKEAIRLLQKPLERAEALDLRGFLETVIRTATENIETLRRLAGKPPE